MILRCRCRSLLSRQSLKPLSYHPLPDPSSLNHNRPIHLTIHRRAKDPLEQADEEGREIDELDESEPEIKGFTEDINLDGPNRRLNNDTAPTHTVRQTSLPPASVQTKREMKTYDEIDASMSIEELGLKSIVRKQKREFIRWLIQEGNRDARFPQHILMDIESRRIEQIRKRAEDRMFTRLNNFYNSLTFEEIQNGTLSGEVLQSNKGGRNEVKSRPQQP